MLEIIHAAETEYATESHSEELPGLLWESEGGTSLYDARLSALPIPFRNAPFAKGDWRAQVHCSNCSVTRCSAR